MPVCVLRRGRSGVNSCGVDDIQMCDMCQERRESKISVSFWPEDLRYEMTLGPILVPAIGLDGDCGWCHK